MDNKSNENLMENKNKNVPIPLKTNMIIPLAFLQIDFDCAAEIIYFLYGTTPLGER